MRTSLRTRPYWLRLLIASGLMGAVFLWLFAFSVAPVIVGLITMTLLVAGVIS
jgi:hypothetical protein